MQEIQLPFDIDLPPVKILTARALNCKYEMGNLRSIRVGDTEIIKMIYGAVRNERWETIPYEIQDEKITIDKSGFTIRYTAVYRQQSALYKADYFIEGKADNSIVFSMKGESLAHFKRNRIGICVLQPIRECSGRAVNITRPDGTVYPSSFPVMVSPLQAFREVSQMQWVTGDNLTVRLLLEGDVFETEDQRNWSDSSYKTYSTELHIPMPVDVQPGDAIDQRVTITVSGTTNNSSKIALQPETSEQKVPFPLIGYSRSKEGRPINAELIDWLTKIPFDHYRVAVSMNDKNWLQKLNLAINEALQLNTRLELVVFFSDAFAEELNLLIEQLAERQQYVRSMLLLQKNQRATPHDLIKYLYPIIKKELPAIKIGYGTDFFFADLNRNRPGDMPCDFVSFSLHPQVHTFDNRSMFENLESQPHLIETAADLASGKPVSVSPITLKDRYNPNTGGLIGNYAKNTFADERQHTWLAAIWTLISLQNFSATYSITLYELFGQSGILQVVGQENNQIIKPSPVYEVLSAIHRFKPKWIIKRFSGQNLMMDGLLLEDEKGERLFFKAPAELR